MSEGSITLYSRKEAFVKGAVLERPEKHETLVGIEERTTIKNAKNHLLMKYEDLVSALGPRYSDTSINKTIIELKLDKLVVMIPGLVYNEISRELVPQVYLISKPEKKNYDVPDIYNEVVNVSTEAVLQFLQNAYTFNRDDFWKDLERNLTEGENSEADYPAIIFNIDDMFERADAIYQLEKKVFDQFKTDLQSKLVAKRKAVLLPNRSVFLIHESYMDELFQTLKVFFYNRILPQYESIPLVSRECDVIKLQEEIHGLESENRKTMIYTASKALAVQKYLQEETWHGMSVYPGSLVLSLIRETEKFAGEFYEKKYVAYVYSRYEELKQKICRGEHHASQPVYFMDETEIQNYPLESIEKIRTERTIISTTWELDSGSMGLYMEMTYENFASTLNYLKTIPDRQSWKILAFRQLLQDSEKITPEINPFNNKAFYRDYALLLNNAYLGILPFYYNILLLIDINFIKSLVYKAIKKYIGSTQAENRRENQRKREIKAQARKAVISQKKAFLKRIITRNRILEELDFFYFRQNLIPSVSDIKERFPDIKEATFYQLLDEFKFTVIPSENSEKPGNNILYYPKNITWQYTIEKTRKKIESMRKDERDSAAGDHRNSILMKRLQALSVTLQLI